MQFIIHPRNRTAREATGATGAAGAAVVVNAACWQASKMQSRKMPTKMLIYFQPSCGFVCASVLYVL